MKKYDVDEILQEGIYGAREIRPDERRKFLGTLRERVVVGLTDKQVKKQGIYAEVEELLKIHPQARLLFNGDIDYVYFSHYIELAEKHGIDYRFVSDQESDTEIGLVLAYDHAVDLEEIYVKDQPNEDTKEAPPSSGISSFFKKFFS